MLVSFTALPRHKIWSSFTYLGLEISGMWPDGLQEAICLRCPFNALGDFFLEIIQSPQYVTKWIIRGWLWQFGKITFCLLQNLVQFFLDLG